MKVLISACLLGVNCRYNGVQKSYPEIEKLLDKHTVIPVCPEQLGGLPTPRLPCEIKDDVVYMCNGDNVTENYIRGAEETLKLAKIFDCDCAILKERSPSCGSGEIYDGTFSGTLVPGDGITAALLKKHGIKVYGESEIWKTDREQ